MADIIPIKYLSEAGLKILWEKISNTYLRDSEVLEALTTSGEGKIITSEDDVFIQKKSFDAQVLELNERIDAVKSDWDNIDNDTIINNNGILQTDILLHNDKDTHTLSIVTGSGSVVSRWDYTDFYNEAVKDGILDAVSLVVIQENDEELEPGTYLKFIFNTASGKTPLYVNVTELIDEYTGSTYIDIVKENGKSIISLKVAELVSYMKSNDVFGINGIIVKLDSFEEELNDVKNLINNIDDAWESIRKDINELKTQVGLNKADIENIYAYLEGTPNVPITNDEIKNLK